MSILSALFNNQVQTVEQALGAKDITSLEMRLAIRQWFALYFDGPQPVDEDGCQRLPFLIVNKLTKTVFSEYRAEVQGRTPKAVFMSQILRRLDSVKKTALQQALVGGACFVKPVIFGGMGFTVVRRDCFLPLARGADGRVTSVGMTESTRQGGEYYTLLERRSLDGVGRVVVENKLFVSHNRESIGKQVPLETLAQYKGLKPSLTLPLPLGNLGMVQLKTPMFNCVDGSPDGVAVYAPAVKLIKHINRNEQQLNDEFENGASRIIASADMMAVDENGRRKLSDKQFVAVDESPENVGVTIFSPTLREQSYLARKTEYLRNIENLIGFKHGILSDVEAAERTATEITSSQGDYNLTIQDFQQAWEETLRELIKTCDILGQMYGLCDSSAFDPEKDLVIDWGNGVLFDADKEWNQLMQMVAAGMLKPEVAVAYKYNLPWDTPEALQKIRQLYMPGMDSLLKDDE